MSRHAWTVAAALFAVAYGTNVATPFLGTYRDRLDLGDSATQLIFVVYVGGILLSLFLAGRISDQLGRRPVVLVAMVVSIAASSLLIVGRNSYGLLLAGRVLLGVSSGAALGVAAAWLQELIGTQHAKKAAWVTTVVTYGGFGIGPPVSAVVDAIAPPALVVPFLFHIGITTLMIPLTVAVPDTVVVDRSPAHTSQTQTPTQTPSQTGSPGKRSLFGVPQQARKPFWLYLAPLAVLVFAFPSLGFALFPLLAADNFGGTDVTLMGIAGALLAGGAMVARPVLDRAGAHNAVLIGALIGSAGYVLGGLSWGTGVWPLVWPASFLLGAASGVLAAAGLTLVAEMADDEARGALSSTFYLIAYCGMAMPLIVTAVAGAIGMGATLAGLTVVALGIAATTPLRRRISLPAY